MGPAASTLSPEACTRLLVLDLKALMLLVFDSTLQFRGFNWSVCSPSHAKLKDVSSTSRQPVEGTVVVFI